MNTPITLKPIGNAYSEEVINLILPIQQQEFNVNIDLKAQQDLLAIEKYYQETGGGFWGAFHGEQLVGTIALIAYQPDAAALRKMFVRKEFRGKEQGIASRLLEELLQHARSQGIKNIYLGTINVMTAALRFYEKKGFNKIAAEDLPPAYPRMAADNVFYHLKITQD